MLADMPHLRLVAPIPPETGASCGTDDRPRVSLRLLMALAGRCSCDGCLLAYRAGDKNAGIIAGLPAEPALHAVR